MAGVKAMKESLFNEFEIKGVWWNPEKPNIRESGILFFRKNDIYLELIGSLNEGYFAIGNDRYEIMHGFSDSGEEFTLIDVFVKNTTSNAPGFQTQTFSIQSFIVGGHFNTLDQIQFHSLSFFPTYLTAWLNRPMFTETTHYEEKNFTITDKRVSFKDAETFTTYVEVLSAKVEETYVTNFNIDSSERVLWTNKSGLKIVPDENKDFSWFLKNMNLLKDILNLFIGHATYFENIIFHGEEENIEGTNKKHKKKFMYFFRQEKSKLKEKFNWSDIIIDFKDINQDLETILNSWFAKHRDLEVVYNLHFNQFYKDIYVETTLLNTIQFFEIYHRKAFDGKVLEKEKYLKLSEDLKGILKENFPEEFATIISNKLNHGNEFSLAMRIKEIIGNFQEETKMLFIGTDEEIKKFVRQLVDTRNYLTHYDSDKKKYIIHDTLQKYYAIQRLRAISTLILFLEVGLDEKLMVKKITKSKQYSYWLSKAKETLN